MPLPSKGVIKEENALNPEIEFFEIDSFSITQENLTDLSVDSVGLIPSGVSGFPNDLWRGVSSEEIAQSLRRIKTNLVPSALELFYVLLLAEANPPLNSDGLGTLFLARIDKLMEFGALDHANGLMSRAGGSVKHYFSRRFNLALLTGNERVVCNEALHDPRVKSNFSQRIYCLVRIGDWKNANLIYEVSKTLGELTPLEEKIISIYLYPELTFSISGIEFEDLTPLHFRMLIDSGYSYSFFNINNTLGYYHKNSNSSWSSRIRVHESLIKSKALPFETLLVTYSEKKPPASGGVWDRVGAIQKLEEAIEFDRKDDITLLFQIAFERMKEVGLAVEFANYFVPRVYSNLVEFGKIPQKFFLPVILSNLSEGQKKFLVPTNRDESFYIDLKFGYYENAIPNSALQESILSGLKWDNSDQKVGFFSDSMSTGIKILEAIYFLQDANQTSPKLIREALETLCLHGFEEEAREVALQILLIENEKYQL